MFCEKINDETKLSDRSQTQQIEHEYYHNQCSFLFGVTHGEDERPNTPSKDLCMSPKNQRLEMRGHDVDCKEDRDLDKP